MDVSLSRLFGQKMNKNVSFSSHGVKNTYSTLKMDLLESFHQTFEVFLVDGWNDGWMDD